ncbi:hypothetical protein CSC17_0217 [Klebsiella oxytoca]|nr:hypothetical protein CSC17_0217 [Klebsiella oxytoca]
MKSGELITATGEIVKRASGNIRKDYQIMIGEFAGIRTSLT